MSGPPLRHIAIEGAIGAGKTSLALRLAESLGAEPMLERPQDNPFLARYYAAAQPGQPNPYALQTQLFFLFQRVEQSRALAEPSMFTSRIVSDFIFAKDALFAEATLSDDEFRLYRLIHAEVAPRLPRPDLVIWLQASAATLMQRVQRRGIAMEQDIDDGYLQRLAAAYGEHFRRDAELPVLAIDTEHFHPGRAPDMERLLRRLEAFRGPREAL